jgi:hypothetical protein
MRIALLLLLLLLPLSAEAGVCPAPSRLANVAVAPLLPLVQETHSASYRELSSKMKQALKPGQDTMGLASSRFDVKFHFDFRVLQRSGQNCYYLSSIEAQFGYDFRRVQIAREVPEGSCLYDEIRKHEYKHVAVDEAAVRENLSYVHSHLRDFAQSLGVVEAANDEATRRYVETALHGAIKPILAHVSALRSAAQDRVDTPAEYARVERACQTRPEALDWTPPPAPSPAPPPSDGNQR